LAWPKVTISLVDERWVEPGQAGSNEDFIRSALIQNKASQANFFGLKTKHQTVEAGLAEAEARFNCVHSPFDICVMGMGSDAHTASWFPNSGGLTEALSLKNQKTLCAINAQGAPVLNAHAIFLFIPGGAKRAVFNDVPNKPQSDAPVQALLRAGPKLHVFASPTS